MDADRTRPSYIKIRERIIDILRAELNIVLERFGADLLPAQRITDSDHGLKYDDCIVVVYTHVARAEQHKHWTDADFHFQLNIFAFGINRAHARDRCATLEAAVCSVLNEHRNLAMEAGDAPLVQRLHIEDSVPYESTEGVFGRRQALPIYCHDTVGRGPNGEPADV